MQPGNWDSESVPRLLITTADGFAEVLKYSFGMIRESGSSNTAVSLKILEALTGITSHASRPEDIEVIRQEAEALQTAFEEHHLVKADLTSFQQAFDQLNNLLESSLRMTREPELS